MSDKNQCKMPEDNCFQIVLEHLRALRADMDELKSKIGEIKMRFLKVQ
jgi:hypothetical protein